jgi:hypothetical protein
VFFPSAVVVLLLHSDFTQTIEPMDYGVGLSAKPSGEPTGFALFNSRR